MGGVDLSNEIITLHDFERKSYKWWKYFFSCVLLMSLFRHIDNAHGSKQYKYPAS